MTVARTVRPTDLVALVSFDGRVYPNEAKTRDRLGRDESAPHPLESAIEQWFSFATGRHTWISVRGATLRGLVSARARGASAAWELDTLINAAEDDEGVCLSLLDRAVEDAGREGAEKVFLRVLSDSAVLGIARRAGFACVTTERLYTHQGPVLMEKGPSPPPLRRRSRADAYPLFQLYNAAVPEGVRHAEAATFAEWLAAQERHWLAHGATQLVMEEDGLLRAWVRAAAEGDIGRFDVLVHPRAEGHIDGLVQAGLSRLSGQGALLALVPDYQEPVARHLVRLGFQAGPEYALLARRTMVPVRAPRLSPAGLKPPLALI